MKTFRRAQVQKMDTLRGNTIYMHLFYSTLNKYHWIIKPPLCIPHRTGSTSRMTQSEKHEKLQIIEPPLPNDNESVHSRSKTITHKTIIFRPK